MRCVRQLPTLACDAAGHVGDSVICNHVPRVAGDDGPIREWCRRLVASVRARWSGRRAQILWARAERGAAVDFCGITLGEVPIDAPQRIIDKLTPERRLTQTARRPCAPAHRAQRHPLIFCYSSKNETHYVHQPIVSWRGGAQQIAFTWSCPAKQVSASRIFRTETAAIGGRAGGRSEATRDRVLCGGLAEPDRVGERVDDFHGGSAW